MRRSRRREPDPVPMTFETKVAFITAVVLVVPVLLWFGKLLVWGL